VATIQGLGGTEVAVTSASLTDSVDGLSGLLKQAGPGRGLLSALAASLPSKKGGSSARKGSVASMKGETQLELRVPDVAVRKVSQSLVYVTNRHSRHMTTTAYIQLPSGSEEDVTLLQSAASVFSFEKGSLRVELELPPHSRVPLTLFFSPRVQVRGLYVCTMAHVEPMRCCCVAHLHFHVWFALHRITTCRGCITRPL